MQDYNDEQNPYKNGWAEDFSRSNSKIVSEAKEKKSERKIIRSIKRIRADMVEINEGQNRIREGQKEVREKFQEISEEAAKLKEETDLISKQSAANPLRFDLMFQIIKARAENDHANDAQLTQILRDLMGKKNLSKSKPPGENQEKD